MGSHILKIHSYWKLGLANVLAVFAYRLRLRVGYYAKSLPITEFGFSEFARLAANSNHSDVSGSAYHEISFYNAHYFEITGSPDWTTDPFTHRSLNNNEKHWSQIPDFALNTGDVKNLWELSRFEWLIRASWQSVYDSNLSTIPSNDWVLDWCKQNPANRGVNWKCAQECSIRAMNVVLSWLIEGQEPTSKDIIRFLQLHAMRIEATISYAKAQNNNHGTSEAAALFVLGIFLGKSDDSKVALYGLKCEKLGRRLLENRVSCLIDSDGTFSQYSVNYQRMLLDTLSFTECVRRRYTRKRFSDQFYRQASLAALWLFDVTDPISGDAPNIGTNDGSMLFNCSGYSARDFRPSTQLCHSLFCSQHVYPEHRHPLSVVFEKALKTPPNVQFATVEKPVANVFKRVGKGTTFAILKCPTDRFRPAQADALHVDVWHEGQNIVRDAGTYSYNPPEQFTEDLGSTAHHSTVQINSRDQMPKLSRFLYGAWLRNSEDGANRPDSADQISGGYRDWQGASHTRSVSNTTNGFKIVDDVTGSLDHAILRWRLSRTNWTLQEFTLSSDLATLTWEANQNLHMRLVDSVESRFYLQLEPVVVLELNAVGPVSFTTRIDFH